MTKEQLFSKLKEQGYKHEKEGSYDFFTFNQDLLKQEFRCDYYSVRVRQEFNHVKHTKYYYWKEIEEFDNMIDLGADFAISRLKENGSRKLQFETKNMCV